MNSNFIEIKKRVENKFEFDINYNILIKILFNKRKTVDDYLKNQYRIKGIGGDSSIEIIIPINDSLFVHNDDGWQL